MATKPFRSSVAASIVQAWAPINSAGVVQLRGGLLAIESGTPAAGLNPVLILTDGTAAAAGTLAYIPLGGTASFAGQGPAAVPFDFGAKGVSVSGAGGLGVKFAQSSVGAGTVTGYFHGVEDSRRSV